MTVCPLEATGTDRIYCTKMVANNGPILQFTRFQTMVQTWNPQHSQDTFFKGKVVPILLTEHHATEVYWRSGGIAPMHS